MEWKKGGKRMTKEERDKLIIEELGGCWHDKDPKYQGPSEHWCPKCNEIFHPKEQEIFISSPKGFFWWWRLAQRKEWWPDFYDFMCIPGTIIFDIEHLDPDPGADEGNGGVLSIFTRGHNEFLEEMKKCTNALAEFLIKRKISSNTLKPRLL